MLNSSSSFNTSHLNPPLPSSPTIHDLMQRCLTSRVGSFSITAIAIMVIIVLLPLCIYVLNLGCQRRRQQHSAVTVNHSDIFTYHMVVIELMNVVGAILSCGGVHAHVPLMVLLGVYLFSVVLCAQILFHVLTCVERYLAVVHPVTYIALRNTKGILIRNIVIGFFWLLSFFGTGVMSLASHTVITITSFCIVTFALIVISFCSVSVLCVLIRRGPGEGGGDKQKVDQSKLRAFHTIMAILGVLVLRFVGNISTNVLYDSEQLGETERCAVWLSEFWFTFPSSLVLPLLFLHRAAKLPCCQQPQMSDKDRQ